MTSRTSTQFLRQDFKFEVLLGQGSFGHVYLVRRNRDNKQFVIKQQDKKSIFNNDSLFSKMIRAEVQCLSVLRHPNVVSYYGAWKEDDDFYILMEYAARGTLKDLLSERLEPLSEMDALYLFAQVVLGVNHIHGKNIMHRDIKPENIMLTGRKGDIIKIGDFGLSRNCEMQYKSHAGSYYYIAPEMIRKEKCDFKSDVWSMGVVLYEMLTKELAFPGTTTKEIMEMISQPTPRKLFVNTKKVSRDVKIIVYKMLLREPSKRPSTRLLLLNPRLVTHVAKVYLNLGRCYGTDSDFNTDIFQPFFNKPLVEIL